MPDQVRVYGYRWVVLAAFMAVNLTIQVLWISYAPVSSQAQDYYGVSAAVLLGEHHQFAAQILEQVDGVLQPRLDEGCAPAQASLEGHADAAAPHRFCGGAAGDLDREVAGVARPTVDSHGREMHLRDAEPQVGGHQSTALVPDRRSIRRVVTATPQRECRGLRPGRHDGAEGVWLGRDRGDRAVRGASHARDTCERV